ncbi:MAG: response regulator [Magnetospirillum sp.]|nr:response regulator [Magnetospirillum sp.]
MTTPRSVPIAWQAFGRLLAVLVTVAVGILGLAWGLQAVSPLDGLSRQADSPRVFVTWLLLAAALLMVGWMVFGRWLAATTDRIARIDALTRHFTHHHAIDDAALTALLTDRHGDELDAVAASLAALMRAVLARDSERAEVAADLAERTQRLHLVLESSGEGIYGLDAQGRCTYVNPAFCAMVGFTADELIGRNIHPLVHHTHADGRPYPTAECRIIRIVRTGIGRRVADEVMWRKDGTAVPVEYGAYPQISDGRIVGAVVNIADVSERRRRESAIREAELRYRTLFQQSPDAIVIVDPQTALPVEFNDNAYHPLGYSRAEFARIPFAETMAGAALDLAQVMEEGGGNVEVRFRTRLGEEREALLAMRPIMLDERPLLLCIGRDISVQKQGERVLVEAVAAAERATLAKGRFLGNVSHEMRTPLNAVLGMLYLLKQGPLAPDQADCAAKIEHAARALMSIIGDLIDIAAIDSGKFELEACAFRLGDLMAGIAGLVAEAAHAKGLDVIVDLAPSLPRTVTGDPVRLRQVLHNVVANAVKFTRQGTVILAAEPETPFDARGTGLVRFRVADTGIGMDTELMARLFQPFSQGDDSLCRPSGGIGLGLVISRQMVETMGGTIQVDSAPGKGSTVTVTLPLPAAAEAYEADLPRLHHRSGDLRVLVVDDHANTRTLLCRQLASLGFDHTEAGDGTAALAELDRARLAEEQPYGLVLLDWTLPGADGAETARRIKADPALGEPRVVMVTGNRNQSPGDAGLRGLIDGLLVKPVAPSALIDALAAALGEPPPPAAAPGPAASGILDGRRLLLVEDNAINSEVARKILQRHGATVTVVEDGQQAVEWIASHGADCDAVLMDVHMPVMDGIQATRCIRQLPCAARLPIVAMTANAMTADREACLRAGMNDHLTKPIEVPLLLGALARAFAAAPEEPEPEPVAADTGDRGLPPLAGIAVGELLDRLMDDAPLARRLLLTFAREQGGAIERLRGLLAAGQRAQARTIAHTLKGAAGNLGARRLMTLAAEMEAALRSEEAILPPLAPLAAAIDEVLTSVAVLEEGDSAAGVGGDDLLASLDDIERRLGRNELDALDLVETIDAARLPAATRMQLTALRKAAERLDFTAARVAAANLKAAIAGRGPS